MILTKQQFFKIVFEKIKCDDSFFNVVYQIVSDYNLDEVEVGEWVKEDKNLFENIKAEYKLKNNINDLFV